MKTRTLLCASLATAVALGAVAAPKVITSYKASEAKALHMPLMTDSVNSRGKKFDASKMLGYKIKTELDRNARVVTTDTAGRTALAVPANDAYITIYETTIRPSRYVKGNLKVTSTARYEVLMDGASLRTKETAEDSLSSASTVSVPLDLQPQKSHKITLKVLTTAEDKDANPDIAAKFEPASDFEDVEVEIAPDLIGRFSLQSCTEGTRVTSTSMSPDGKYVILRYTSKYNKDSKRDWAVLQETATGKIISENVSRKAKWMPKGSTLYECRERLDVYDIYAIDLPTMRERLLVEGVPDNSFMWSPDEKYLICTDFTEGKKEAGPLRRYRDQEDRLPGSRDRVSIIKYDLETGMSELLVYGSLNAILLDVSPDSRKVLYQSYTTMPGEYPFGKNDIIQIDLGTMRADTLVRDLKHFNNALYSPDGKKLFMLGGPQMFGDKGVEKNGHPIPNEFDVQGFIYDIATGDVTASTLNFNPAIDGTPVWNRADGNIYFMGEDGSYVHIYRLNPKTGDITCLPTKVDTMYSFSMGQYQPNYLTYSGGSLETCGMAFLQDLKKGTAQLIDDPMLETLESIQLGTPSTWTFTASDGTLIDGFMVTPPDFDPSKKYPLIVYYYGGTTPTQRAMTSPYSPQLFASRDYVVYVVNPSGTIGYGQEFSARHVNAWGKRTSDDIIEGVKKFFEEHPFVNADKIGCIGASYGGFMTQYLLTKTDIFAAAVSHAGISNVTSYWGEGYWGYSYNSVAAAKSYPWSNPELFTKQGSLFNADKIHTPLLLLHGTVDTNVPIGESIQLFNALKILNREVEFISVDDQDHFIQDPDKQVLWHATIMAWFAKWLQDDPRWWDSMYGEDD